MITPIVAFVEVVQHAPDLSGRLAFPYAECRNLVTRFHDPRSRNAVEKLIYLIRPEGPDEFRTRDPCLGRKVAAS